jgi:ketosteroid isomerase-like protein
MQSTRDRVERLIAMAEQGKFLEAIEEFYAPDATMQENNQPPRRGLAALLENERRVLDSLQ